MNESSVPLYRIGGKPFYNKPRVGSIVRGIEDVYPGYNKLGRITEIHEASGTLTWLPLDSDILLDYRLHNQDITWELVLE